MRYALIGGGMMGQEHIRNVALLDGVEIAGVADPDEGMRRAAAALAGAPGYACHAEMLAELSPDAILIATPNNLHGPQLQDLFRRTEVPILCEKPLGVSLPECRDIVAAAAGRRGPVWVAMEYRYMPPVARLIEEVRAGTPGRPVMLSIREHRFPFLEKVGVWNRFAAQTGGTLVEKCCHFFDLMRHILADEPVRIHASGGMDVNHLDEEYAGRRPDILDNAFVTVEFAGGARAMLDLCMFAEGSAWQEVISVTGAAARVDAMIPGPGRFAAPGQERVARVAISDRATKAETVLPIEVDETILAAGDHHGATFFQHRKFADLVQTGRGAAEVGLADGLKAVGMGAAAEASAAAHCVITFDGDWSLACPTS
ncbi:MAG: Gfo/Idh/MocA family oxidoreductase [Pseudomonadota bacterium]